MSVDFSNRIQTCQQCNEGRGNRCRLANQVVTVMARMPRATCPVGRWDRTKPPIRTGKAKPTTPILETERIARYVTIGISAFRRPGCVERLVKSIRRFYPTTKIIVGDNGDQPAQVRDEHLTYLQLPFNIGLSATRNRIVHHAKTPYFWLLDDDYEFTADTDCGRFLDVLDADPKIGVVGGAVVENTKSGVEIGTWGQQLILENGVLNGKPVQREIRFAGRTQYYLADTANNFALFRREMLADHLWTEPLKLREHADYYWRVKQAGRWQVAVCEQVRCKHLRIQSSEYQEHRHRNREFLQLALESLGVRELNILPGSDPRMGVDGRPNIVVLGVGNSGTTIVTKMLHALGWQAADADETFGESVRLRDINESGDFSGAAGYLAGLPQPWAIKDPRLVRLEVCQTCKERRGNRCRLANQIVSVMIRMPTATCPLGRWPNARKKVEPKPKVVSKSEPSGIAYPETHRRTINRLAAVTCHFNPCGYQLLESNYHRFIQALPADLELWTIELAYGEVPFRLPDGPRMLSVRGDERHVLWQKERLLHLAMESLPKDVDAVAWLDADLIFLNRDWVAEACKLLERYNAVQLFEQIYDTDREGRLGQKFPGHVFAKTQGLGYGRPGGAWAARRDVLTDGLYDRHAVVGGDTAVLFAWEGREKLPPTLNHGTAWELHYRTWANRSFSRVQSSLACVPGDIVHLYHGSRPNRQYGTLHDSA